MGTPVKCSNTSSLAKSEDCSLQLQGEGRLGIPVLEAQVKDAG